MVKKSKFLKNLLTTVSALTVAANAGSVYADTKVQDSNVNPALVSAAASWVSGSVPIAGDQIVLTAAAAGLTVDRAYSFGNLNLYGNNATVNVTLPGASFTDVVSVTTTVFKDAGNNNINAGATASPKATFNINGANINHTFLGVTNVGQINLQAGATATFKKEGKVEAKIDGNANNGAVVADANLTFSGAIGGAQAIDSFTINQGRVVTFANTVKFKANGAVAISDGASLTVEGGTGASFKTSDAVTIGNNALLTVKGGAGVTFEATNIDGVAVNQGVLAFEGDVQVTTKIGNKNALAAVNVLKGTVDFKQDVIKATDINLVDTTSVLKLSSANATNITANVSGGGQLEVNGGNATVRGNLGSKVKFTADKTLELIGPDLKLTGESITTSATGAGTVVIKATTATLNTNFGADGTVLKAVQLQSFPNGTAGKFTLATGKAIYAGQLDLAVNNADNNILILSDGTTIKAEVMSSNANIGTLQIAGDATVNKIADTVKSIEFTVDGKKLTLEDAAASGVPFTKSLKVPVTFTADGILEYTGAETWGIEGEAVVVASGTKGSITANNLANGKTLIFSEQIGDVTNGKSLKLLQAKGGADIDLRESAAIDTIDIGSQDVKINLSKVNAQYLIGAITHDDGKGTLVINEDSTLKKGSLAKETKKLKAISFVGDKRLTVEDGVKLLATSVVNATANEGSFEFNGSATIDAAIGKQGQAFKQIAVNKGTVAFSQDLYLANGLVLGSDAEVQLSSKTVSTKIDGSAPNNGTLTLNGADMTIALAVGNVQPLKVININGKKIAFSSADVKVNTLNFGATTGSEVDFTALAADSLQNVAITNKGGSNTLTFGQNQIFGSVGSSAPAFGTLKFKGDQTATIKGQVFADIQNSKDGEVTVVVNNGSVGNLGTDTSKIKLLRFTGLGSVGSVSSIDIQVDTGQTANFNGTVSSKNALQLAGAGSRLVLNSGSTLNVAVKANTANNGAATFNAGSTVAALVGNTNALDTANFAGAGAVTFTGGGAVNAKTITFAKETQMLLNSDAILTGTTGAISQVELKTNTLTFAGSANFADASTVTVNYDPTQAAKNGKIVVTGKANTLDLSKVTSLTININDTSGLPDSNGAKVVLFNADATATITAIDQTKVNLKSTGNRFAAWTFDATTNTLTQTNNAKEAVKDILGKTADNKLLTDAVSLVDPKNTGDARAVVKDLTTISDDKQIADAITRLTKPIGTNTEIVESVVKHNPVNPRLSSLAAVGAAAGEAETETAYGVWATPIFAQATQKGRGNEAAGYRANSYGATVGADILANPDLVLGVAGTYVKSDVKHKNFKSGDKTKSDTWMLSLYALQKLHNEFFVQGLVNFGTTKVTNTETRKTSKGSQFAKGKYDASTFSADVVVGYNYKLDQVLLTPTAGVGFTRIGDGDYKETGTTNQNLKITRKSVTRTEILGGLKAQMETMVSSGFEWAPELHASVRHVVNGKNPQVIAKLDGANATFAPKIAKLEKTSYNVGLGINGKTGMYDLGVGYDAFAAKKYMAHQGSLKVRVNF